MWWDESFILTRFFLLRGMAFIYAIAFFNAWSQFRPLSGENGLLPLGVFINRTDWRQAPSLLRLWPTDRAIGWISLSGFFLACIALTGWVDPMGVFPNWLLWGLLWILYLSLVNTGQLFYGFGWESLLLESGFLTIFLSPSAFDASMIGILLFRWLLFRVMFGAGLIKVRGSRCWKDLTCLFYYYETQPMPNPFSWFFHHLPRWFHRFGVIFNHFVELVVPFAYFAPAPISTIAGILTILFQSALIISGNLSWLNYLTIVLAFSCFDDTFWQAIFPMSMELLPTIPWIYQGVWIALASFVIFLSVRPTLNLISKKQTMNRSYDSLHLVNTYGAFGSISQVRHELIFEGTDDPNYLDSDAIWKEYEFKGKPGDPNACPSLVAPYHHRLGWLLWFAAMRPCEESPWLFHLVAKLLQGDKELLTLLSHNPFPEHPPKAIRIRLFLYAFTPLTGWPKAWWRRSSMGIYLDPVSLETAGLKRILRYYDWLPRSKKSDRLRGAPQPRK